jgi:hypothetical protein
MEKLMHNLQDIVNEKASPEERQRHISGGRYTYYRVDHTDRSSEVPPPRAPHNFGISKDWYEENCRYPQLRKVLLDWMQWPGPEGWDTADEDGMAE